MVVMLVGGAFLMVGVAMATLYFTVDNSKDSKNSDNSDNSGDSNDSGVKHLGPIFLSIGLLVSVCGIVWVQIIRRKIKKQLERGYL